MFRFLEAPFHVTWSTRFLPQAFTYFQGGEKEKREERARHGEGTGLDLSLLGCHFAWKPWVAVGTPVTRHPPHRSVLAELPHTAPASGHDANLALG